MTVKPALLGVGREIRHGDQTHTLRLLTDRVQAEFERKLAARALERINQRQKQLTREEYLAELRVLGEREDRGEFSFLTNVSTALTTAWGRRALLELLLDPRPAAEALDAMLEERGEEMMWLLQRTLRESLPMTTKALGMKDAPDPFAPETDESPPTSTPSSPTTST